MNDDDQNLLLPPERPEGYEYFASHEERTIDDKGRIILPNLWRDKFLDGGRITEWKGRLALWTMRSWGETEGRLEVRELRELVPKGTVEAFRRFTHLVTVDGQGRMALPVALRERVGIGGHGAVVSIDGLGNYLGISPAERTSGMNEDDLQAAIADLPF